MRNGGKIPRIVDSTCLERPATKYMTGVVQNYGHKMLAINNMPDHMYIFFGFRPNQSLADLMRIVKSESSKWINDKQFTPAAFNWQEGYGAFSYSRSHVTKITE